MKFLNRHDEDLQINLTPLIDVVFLLLIFFMVSTTFTRESQMQIRLPEANVAQPVEGELTLLEIQISEIEQYAIRGPNDPGPKSLINSDEQTLYLAMREAIGEVTADPIVVIRADRRAPHEAVVRAMDAARRLNLMKITFATINNTE